MVGQTSRWMPPGHVMNALFAVLGMQNFGVLTKSALRAPSIQME